MALSAGTVVAFLARRLVTRKPSASRARIISRVVMVGLLGLAVEHRSGGRAKSVDLVVGLWAVPKAGALAAASELPRWAPGREAAYSSASAALPWVGVGDQAARRATGAKALALQASRNRRASNRPLVILRAPAKA